MLNFYANVKFNRTDISHFQLHPSPKEDVIFFNPSPLASLKTFTTFALKYVNTFLPKRETVTDRRRHMDT